MTTLAGNRMDDNFIKEQYGNKALDETLALNDVRSGDYIDAYNRTIRKDIAGTITTRVSDSNQTFIADEPKKIVEFGSYYTREDKQGNINTQCNRAANEDNCALTVACAETGKVLEKQTYRIRKLTPKECGRLMGVKDEDIDKMSVNQSNSKLYHLYGDSIVVDVLMAILGEMM